MYLLRVEMNLRVEGSLVYKSTATKTLPISLKDRVHITAVLVMALLICENVLNWLYFAGKFAIYASSRGSECAGLQGGSCDSNVTAKNLIGVRD